MKSALYKGLLLTLFFSAAAIATEDNRAPRIVNGNLVPSGYAPWQVFLKFDNGDGTFDACGGMIIAPDYVLTAAHCADGHVPTQVTVIAGVDDLSQHTSANALAVSQVAIPSFYNSTTFTGDLALIELADPLPATAKPIALLTANEQIAMDAQFSNQVSNNLFVAGWGAIKTGGSIQADMRYTFLSGVPDAQCSWTQNGGGSAIICANQTYTTGVCNGDSGGALVWQDPNLAGDPDKGYRAAGIVSFSDGILGCGSTQAEDAFTQISTYYNWINTTMSAGYTEPVVSFSRDIFSLPTTEPVPVTSSGGGGGAFSWLGLVTLTGLFWRRRLRRHNC